MAIVRLAPESDATWCRAWIIDTTAEVLDFLDTYNQPNGPKRGDMIVDNETAQLYIVTNANGISQISGLATLPVNLVNDVTGTLPVGFGGTGLATLAAGRIPFGDTTNPLANTANLAYAASGGLSLNNLLDISQSSGGQIKFPASQHTSADANTLDDYEEGSWTPVLRFGGASVGITYSTQLGQYVKIGRFVFVTGAIVLSSKGSSVGNADFSGLPFTINGGSFGYFSTATVDYGNFNAAVVGAYIVGIIGSSTFVPKYPAAGTPVQMTDASFNNNSALLLGGFGYFV